MLLIYYILSVRPTWIDNCLPNVWKPPFEGNHFYYFLDRGSSASENSQPIRCWTRNKESVTQLLYPEDKLLFQGPVFLCQVAGGLEVSMPRTRLSGIRVTSATGDTWQGSGTHQQHHSMVLVSLEGCLGRFLHAGTTLCYSQTQKLMDSPWAAPADPQWSEEEFSTWRRRCHGCRCWITTASSLMTDWTPQPGLC